MDTSINNQTSDGSVVTYSGTCGDHLTWEFDSRGLLTISGTGDMNDYMFHGTPWKSFKRSIKKIVLDGTITGIGDFAFYGC